MNSESEIRRQLKEGGLASVKDGLRLGAYDGDERLRNIVKTWIDEQEAPKSEAREKEHLDASKRANEIAKHANRISSEANDSAQDANKLAAKANKTAILAVLVALAALAIQALPYLLK